MIIANKNSRFTKGLAGNLINTTLANLKIELKKELVTREPKAHKLMLTLYTRKRLNQ